MIEVFLDIRTQQQYPDNVEKKDITTPAKLLEKGDSIYITYKETELTGIDGTMTIKIENNVVILNRIGTNGFKQVFQEGQIYKSIYQTQYGNFLFDILPSVVDIDLTVYGGSIKLKYELLADGKKMSDNSLEIDVKLLNI